MEENKEQEEMKYEEKTTIQKRLIDKSEDLINEILDKDNEIDTEDLKSLSQLVDIHKDICQENYWLRKENKNMNYGNYGNNYGNYGNYSGRGPGHESYGRNSYGEYNGNSYGRRGVDSKYRGHEYMDGMYEEYGRYEDGREQYNRGNYGAKDDALMSLKYMLESMTDFVKMLKSEANSQEEMQLIREYTQKISQM